MTPNSDAKQMWDQYGKTYGDVPSKPVREYLEGHGIVQFWLKNHHNVAVVRAEVDAHEQSRARVPREPKTEPKQDCGRVALSKIQAMDAATDSSVVAFREDVLGGKLLSHKGAAEWIDKQAAQSTPTHYATIPIPSGLEMSYDVDAPYAWLPAVAAQLSTVTNGPVGGHMNILTFSRPGSEWAESVLVEMGSPLDSLRIISNSLSSRYLWTDDQATMFVLTGIPPLVPLVQRTITMGSSPGGSEIALRVRPQLTTKEVGAAYQEARRTLYLWSGARVSERNPTVEDWVADLAVLMAEMMAGGVKGPEAMDAWNSTHPESTNTKIKDHRFSDVNKFRRAARVAYERVTGAKATWEQEREGETS